MRVTAQPVSEVSAQSASMPVDQIHSAGSVVAADELWRHRILILLALLAVPLFWTPLGALFVLSVHDDRYTHILVIPIVSVVFLWLDRKRISSNAGFSVGIGVPLLLLGLTILFVSKMKVMSPDSLSLAIGALIVLMFGAFILCYGTKSFRCAAFPLLFLFLAVPVPGAILDKVVAALQEGSATLAYLLFRIAGVPVLRHGMVMSLPGVEIEVAPQCSGIRSSMGLLVVGLVISQVMLRSGWMKAFVILCLGPIAIFRNAVRIASLSWLAVYVDRSFLFGSLHHRGGVVFALIGFAVLIPLVWILRKWEDRAGVRRARGGGSELGGSSAPAS